MPEVARTPAKPIQLDAVSKAIIEQLQSDGRRSYAEIGKAVGLSEAAVRQRVQKLTESGVMQVVAVTDPMQLGFYRQAMVGIRVAGDTTTVADEIAKLAAVDYVVLTAGSFDLLVEVVCENDDDLIALLNQQIRGIAGVQSTETFVYLKLVKQFYNWGTR
jgi:Lrp/AsnC family transcriptional regulator for asnA, asnC and gidA